MPCNQCQEPARCDRAGLCQCFRERMQTHAALVTETITWRPAAPESMPDADLTVNVATIGSEEPVWLGAFDGEVWRDTEGMQIDVTHWAPMLAGPVGVAPCYGPPGSYVNAAGISAADMPHTVVQKLDAAARAAAGVAPSRNYFAEVGDPPESTAGVMASHEPDDDAALSLADHHAEESREDGRRVFERGGLIAFARELAAHGVAEGDQC